MPKHCWLHYIECFSSVILELQKFPLKGQSSSPCQVVLFLAHYGIKMWLLLLFILWETLETFYNMCRLYPLTIRKSSVFFFFLPPRCQRYTSLLYVKTHFFKFNLENKGAFSIWMSTLNKGQCNKLKNILYFYMTSLQNIF